MCKKVPVNFRTSSDVLEKLKKHAEIQERSLSSMIDIICKKFIEGEIENENKNIKD